MLASDSPVEEAKHQLSHYSSRTRLPTLSNPIPTIAGSPPLLQGLLTTSPGSVPLLDSLGAVGQEARSLELFQNGSMNRKQNMPL